MKILEGNNLETLKTLADNSVDSVVTDPPYGLAFMGKKWDYDVPSVALWREVFRVLKPGGHVLSFGGTRTYHRMVVNIEDAGFEIRDQLQWIYGSGFPKSHNLPGGIGTALKPANEPIVLARKPLVGTVAANVEQYGTGGLNIDASRIEAFDGGKGTNLTASEHNETGRWPANILFDEEAAAVLDAQAEATSRFFYVAKASKKEKNKGLDECDHNECDHVCTLKPIKTKQGNRPGSPDMTGKFPDHDHRPSGGNNHPTVKPVKLMEYLVRLVTPQNGTVLDPFMGSGTTGVACKNLGFNFIGCELDSSYAQIAKKRMEAI